MQTTLGAQIVPAEQKHPDWYLQRPGTRHDVRLRRPKVHERRHQHNIWTLQTKKLVVQRIRRQPLLSQAERSVQELNLARWDCTQHGRYPLIVHRHAQFFS